MAGTDTGSPVSHGCLAEEIESFVAAGVRTSLAMKSATVWDKGAVGFSGKIGLIAPEQSADLWPYAVTLWRIVLL